MQAIVTTTATETTFNGDREASGSGGVGKGRFRVSHEGLRHRISAFHIWSAVAYKVFMTIIRFIAPAFEVLHLMCYTNTTQPILRNSSTPSAMLLAREELMGRKTGPMVTQLA